MEFTFIQNVVIWALPVLFAITLHEVAHGWVASWFGDYTAKFSGRLSLNPIKHIDLVGTIILPLLMLFFTNFIFGWAKPVPVDVRNLRHPRRDMVFVSLAGPMSNFLMAFLWGSIGKCGSWLSSLGNEWLGAPLLYMGIAGITINVVLGVLNLIPIPPLDGSRALMGMLPRRSAYYFSLLEPYGFFILLLLLYLGLLSFIIGSPVSFLIISIRSIFGLF